MTTSDHDIVLIEELSLPASIGIYDHEKVEKQTILVSVKAYTKPNSAHEADDIQNALSYEDMIKHIEAMVHSDHVELVETLAERIAEDFFSKFRIIESLIVSIKKPDIIKNAKAVGIEIHRTRA